MRSLEQSSARHVAIRCFPIWTVLASLQENQTSQNGWRLQFVVQASRVMPSQIDLQSAMVLLWPQMVHNRLLEKVHVVPSLPQPTVVRHMDCQL